MKSQASPSTTRDRHARKSAETVTRLALFAPFSMMHRRHISSSHDVLRPLAEPGFCGLEVTFYRVLRFAQSAVILKSN
jgi:hypothetical protein